MRGITRWDGTAWQPLGTGFLANPNEYPLAVLQWGSDLVATGEFSQVGGAATNNIARWDGSAWQALGAGLDGEGYVLEIFEGDLIVGGEFTHAGGIPAVGVARWNGSSWSAMGDNTLEITALRVVNGHLLAAGEFLCGGQEYHGLGVWNGQSWSLLGSGFGTGYFGFIEPFQGDLYVGGSFGWANGHASFSIARRLGGATLDAPQAARLAGLELHGPRPNPSTGDVALEFSLPSSTTARLAIFDIAGRRRAILARGMLSAGRHRVRWSGLDDGGAPCAAGLFLARLETPLGTRVVKLIRDP